MSAATAPVIAPVAPTPASTPTKKNEAKKPKAPRTTSKSSHPTWAIMMAEAVKSLNEKGGSSVPAIKKYILANFKVDADKITPHMRRGLMAAITSGSLTQVKGKGLSGSFKLGGGKAKPTKSPAKADAKKTIKIKKPATPTKKAAKKPKNSAKAKKTETPKKTVKAATKPAAKPAPQAPKAKKAKTPAKPKPAATKKPAAKKPIGNKGKSAKAPKSPKAPKPKTTKKVPKAAAPKKQ